MPLRRDGGDVHPYYLNLTILYLILLPILRRDGWDRRKEKPNILLLNPYSQTSVNNSSNGMMVVEVKA